MGSTVGVKDDLILALRSQIFEYLRETFHRHDLESYLEPARSERKMGGKKGLFLRKHLAVIDLLKRRGWWGHISPLAPALGPQQKNWLLPFSAVYGGQYHTDCDTFE